MTQLHKRFINSQVEELMERYLKKEISRDCIEQILGIGKTRFFTLFQRYRQNPSRFSIQYVRAGRAQISLQAESNILKELSIEKKLIGHEKIPLKTYNYSYIKDRLKYDYKQNVSLPTIINRAKKHGFYLQKPKRTVHDREVLTHYNGELIQHDSSFHLWAPDSKEKLQCQSHLCSIPASKRQN